jgi:hypothetical protein
VCMSCGELAAEAADKLPRASGGDGARNEARL